MIRAILWDIDGTLLDFSYAERAAIQTCFSLFDLGICSDSMLSDYASINRKYWEALERGELTKNQVLINRFEEFFQKYGLPSKIAETFNQQYQLELGKTFRFFPHAKETVLELKKEGVLQVAASNGTRTAQRNKLHGSGLDQILDAIFISDEIGAEKPSPEFFSPVLSWIMAQRPGISKDEILIVGDSLTSDMQGGWNSGIRTAWFCPPDSRHPASREPDWFVSDLYDIVSLIKEPRCTSE